MTESQVTQADRERAEGVVELLICSKGQATTVKLRCYKAGASLGYDACSGGELIDAIALELAKVRQQARAEIQAVVNQQAEDDGLWFQAKTAPEAYLQQELRRLHAAIEGDPNGPAHGSSGTS